MNLRRTLSKRQAYYLAQIGRGTLAVRYDEEIRRFVVEEYTKASRHRKAHMATCSLPASKSRGRHLRMSGDHFNSAMIEIIQRGLLVREDDRLVLSKDARKNFGSPPTLPMPARAFQMSRTRAARVQSVRVPKDEHEEAKV